jgi:hypothetical protein
MPGPRIAPLATAPTVATESADERARIEAEAAVEAEDAARGTVKRTR